MKRRIRRYVTALACTGPVPLTLVFPETHVGPFLALGTWLVAIICALMTTGVLTEQDRDRKS